MLTPLEAQLVAECEKLIRALRGVSPDMDTKDCEYVRNIADEVEDFIVNNCGD